MVLFALPDAYNTSLSTCLPLFDFIFSLLWKMRSKISYLFPDIVLSALNISVFKKRQLTSNCNEQRVNGQFDHQFFKYNNYLHFQFGKLINTVNILL